MTFSLPGIKVTCQGQPGHGSMFIENTAGQKMVSLSCILHNYLDLCFSFDAIDIKYASSLHIF